MNSVRFCLFASALLYIPLLAAAEPVTLKLQAGKQDRVSTPVFWELPAALRKAPGFTLTREEDGKNVPVQITQDDPPRIMWIIGEELRAGQSRQYRLSPTAESPAAPAVTCRDNGRQLVVSVGDKPVLHYNHAIVPAPNADEAYYARSGYLHPLFAPDGQILTGDFAPDHPHQHGVMFAWTNTTFEGRDINFWDQKSQTAKIEHVAIGETFEGQVAGGFRVALRHTDLTAPEGPKPVLDETWDVRVYNVSDGFLFDVHSTQRCAGDSPLTINQYHYGGMAIRGRREWLKAEGAEFLTSTGKTRDNGNHSRPDWVTMSGQLDGRPYDVTMFASPYNFRAPQPLRLHPSKPYFVFAPLVLGEFQIRPGTPYESRYRFHVAQGAPNVKRTQQLWQDYADPPQVTLIND